MGQPRVIAGRYRLEEPAGLGGMGSVWRAVDLELERPVAVKLLGRDADRRRFEREARAAASLAHPNVCRLWDYGDSEDGPFMVLELLPAGTLDDRLVPGEPLPDDETERIASDVASGLAAAHAHGLVHRDLKPANVLFDEEGRAKIADFGIARVGGAGTITEAGTVMGTAAYISPEQAAGLPAGPPSDVYSFGVILFQMLTGRLPFEAAEPTTLLTMHANEAPPGAAEVRPEVPADLAALAAAALRKDAAGRPVDGSALVAALAGGDGAETFVLEREPLAGGGRRRPGRGAAVAAAVLLLALSGGGLAFVATRAGGEDEPPEPPRTTATLPETGTGAEEPAPAPAPAPTEPEETQTETETEPPPPTTEPEPTEPPPSEPPPPTEIVPTEVVPTLTLPG